MMAAVHPQKEQNPGKLQGKVIVVTGGGSGFGAGIVKKLVSEGGNVTIMDINLADAEELARTLPEGRVHCISGDVSSQADWIAALKATLAAFGSLDVVVNNAGVLHKAQPSIDVSEAEFERIFRINVKSLYWSSKVVIPYFTANKRPGNFINISSMSGARPRPNLVWYGASKGAINTATKGLAVEWAKDNIRFNAICPSVGDTAMMPLFLGHDFSQNAREHMLSSIPLGRVCMPADVGNAVSFLASEEANYMTGVCMDVDGGRGI